MSFSATTKIAVLIRNGTKIGAGQYGRVYRTVYRGVEVAVKRIERDFANDSRDPEMSALRELNHPNIIKLLHAEDDDNFTYVY